MNGYCLKGHEVTVEVFGGDYVSFIRTKDHECFVHERGLDGIGVDQENFVRMKVYYFPNELLLGESCLVWVIGCCMYR